MPKSKYRRINIKQGLKLLAWLQEHAERINGMHLTRKQIEELVKAELGFEAGWITINKYASNATPRVILHPLNEGSTRISCRNSKDLLLALSHWVKMAGEEWGVDVPKVILDFIADNEEVDESED